MAPAFNNTHDTAGVRWGYLPSQVPTMPPPSSEKASVGPERQPEAPQFFSSAPWNMDEGAAVCPHWGPGCSSEAGGKEMIAGVASSSITLLDLPRR